MFFAAQLYVGFFDFGQPFRCICTIAFTASRRRNPATNSAKTYMSRFLNRFMLNIVEQFGEKKITSLHALRATMGGEVPPRPDSGCSSAGGVE